MNSSHLTSIPETGDHKLKNHLPESSGFRGIFRLLFGLVLGLLVGGLGIALALMPTTNNVNATATALRLTGQAQAETELDHWQTQTVQADTQSVLDSKATELHLIEQAQGQTELDNRRTQTAQADTGLLLDQTATQAVQNIVATQTALAIQNQQQSTRAAIDYAVTQAALNQVATQIVLDFQSTQAALNQNTAVIPMNVTVTPLPDRAIINDTFASGISGGTWEFSNTGWATGSEGLTATIDGAWILSRRSDLANYQIKMKLLPVPGEYTILLNVQDSTSTNGNLALQLSADEERFGLLRLYPFDPEMLRSGREQEVDATSILVLAVINHPLIETILTVEVVADQMRILLDDEVVLMPQLTQSPSPGAVGLQLPTGATIRQIQITLVEN